MKALLCLSQSSIKFFLSLLERCIYTTWQDWFPCFLFITFSFSVFLIAATWFMVTSLLKNWNVHKWRGPGQRHPSVGSHEHYCHGKTDHGSCFVVNKASLSKMYNAFFSFSFFVLLTCIHLHFAQFYTFSFLFFSRSLQACAFENQKKESTNKRHSMHSSYRLSF